MARMLVTLFASVAMLLTICDVTHGQSLLDLWNGTAHFVRDQNPAPVPSIGHREAFAVARPDISPGTIFLYHRCFPGGAPPAQICLSQSNDSGQSFPVQYGVVIPTTYGFFSVAPSVANVNGVWTMVYEEGGSAEGTYWATSTDGISWTRAGALFPEPIYRATPSLYQFQGVVYVFYAQFNGPQGLGIIFHSGPSMSNLVQWGGGFVLIGSQAWDAGSVSMPRIVFSQGYHWMFYEGGTQNFHCGYGSGEQNAYGWGLARSATLTSWEKTSLNPVQQSNDPESCGPDMPQPFIDPTTGSTYVYYTSDDTGVVYRDRIAFGTACDPATKPYPDWREKNGACLPSCGAMGGTLAYQTKDCQAGTKLGTSWDCVSCCR